jgi:hypothetical protein
LVVVEILIQGPTQGCWLKSEQILGNRTSGDLATFSDLPIADVTVKL